MSETPTLPPTRGRLDRLAGALNIQPGEGLPLFLLVAQAFCMGIALITFYAASNAIFLTAFSSDRVPYVYIAAAAFITTAGIIFTRLQQRVSFSWLLLGTLGFLLVTVVGLWVGLLVSSASWLAFLALVWSRILWVLGNLELWALAGRLFNVRQGKRLFTMITAGAVFGVIVFGFLTTPLIRLFGTVNLILVAGLGLGAAWGVLVYTLRRFRAVLETAPQPAADGGKPVRRRGGLMAVFRNPYTVLIFTYTTFSTIGTYVLDFAFISQAGSRFADVDALGNFFGNYLGFSTLANLLFLTLAAGWILNRFGLRGGILADPVMVAVGTLAVMAAAFFSAGVEVVFWLIVATKLFDDVMVVAMTNTSVRILYQPLTTEDRLTAQAVVESIIAPLAIGFSGIMLIFFASVGNFGAQDALRILLGVLVIWMSAGLLLSNRYKTALQGALKKRVLGTQDLEFEDRSSQAVFEQALQSTQPGEVLFALDVLEKSGYEKLLEVLPALVAHPAPEVRRAGLSRLAVYRDAAAYSLVQERLAVETDAGTRAVALQTLCALGGDEALEAAVTFLDDPDPVIQQGVLLGLMRSGGMEGMLAAGRRLFEMEQDPDPQVRSRAAEIYGRVGISGVARSLGRLLQDPDPWVRKAAVQAAGKAGSPQLWPGIIAALAHPTTSRAAVMAFTQADERALAEIQAAFAAPETPSDVSIRLVQAAGRLRPPHGVPFLLGLVDALDLGVRARALQGLVKQGYQAGAGRRPEIESRLRVEAEAGAQLTAALVGMEEVLAVPTLLARALQDEVRDLQERVFALLSFLFDREIVFQVQKSLSAVSEERRAYAVEALDLLLPQQEKVILFPLLQPLAPKKRAAALAKSFPQETRDHTAVVRWLLAETGPPVSDWTRACAIYAAVHLELWDVIESLPRPGELGWISQETLDWARSIHRSAAGDQVALKGKTPMLLIVEKVIILKSVSIFSETPENVLADLAGVMEEVTRAAGETIFEKGDLGSSLYVIVEGEVRVHDGDHTLNLLSDRDVFGEMALLDPEPRSASITTMRETRLLRLEQDAFYELMDERSEIAQGIIRVLTRRLRTMNANVG